MTLTKKLRIFGERVAITELKEEYEGEILLPENRHVVHSLGEVVSVGDGKWSTGEPKEMFLKEGDIVFYQCSGMVLFNNMFKVGDVPILIMHQGDIIARLTSRKVAIENFTVCGNFLLCEKTYERPSLIIIPDNAEQATKQEHSVVHYHVVQVGNTVKLPVEVGQEVTVHQGRANPLQLNGKEYVYVDQANINGIIAAA
jgi:co-chaperonin GroES (HSP10)